MRKRVVLVSLDALSGSELPLVSKAPGFGRFVKEGAYCSRELSVFPSLTFPCHASIATGCTPGHHGIVHNYLIKPKDKRDYWNFYVSNLKRRAIWDYAADAGKKVLSMSWPVSSGADILWSMPEMTPAKPKIWKPEIFDEQMKIFRDYGNEKFAQEVFNEQPDLIRYWFEGKQPQLDEQMLTSFEHQIRVRDFDIALLHVYGMDNCKHVYGQNSAEAHRYLPLYDRFAKNLVEFSDSRKKEGEDVTILITGDHAQKDVRFLCFGNELIASRGLLTFEGDRIKDCRAYFHGGGGMAYLYIFDQEHRKEILEECRYIFAGNPAFAHIYEQDSAPELGCDSKADLIFAAADGYALERAKSPRPTDEWGLIPSDGIEKADHGYLPNDDTYYTMFFAYGPSVKHTDIPSMSIMDIIPSVCDFLGLSTDETDGSPVENLFS